MPSRRQLLLGLAGAGVAGTSYAVGSDSLSVTNPAQELLNQEPLAIGDTTTVDSLQLTARRIETASGASFDGQSWQAPQGAQLAAFQIRAVNETIDSAPIPEHHPELYQQLQQPDNGVLIGEPNDIAVVEARLPDFAGAELMQSATVNDTRISIWPRAGALSPNSSMTGWVWGVLEDSLTPKLRVKTASGGATWTA